MSEFDKTLQYGVFVEIVFGEYPIHHDAIYHIVGFNIWCEEAVELAKKWLQPLIDKHIPLEYQDRIEWIIKPPLTNNDPYCACGTVGWKYTPKDFKPKWNIKVNIPNDKLVLTEPKS